MIIAHVRFPLPAGTDRAAAQKLFQGSAPKYQNLAGLIRKYYVFDADAGVGGGNYIWESRAAAEAVYDDDWKAMIADRYGAAPEITYIETLVIVDNQQGFITST